MLFETAPESALRTETLAVPVETMSLPRMLALRVVVSTNVVERVEPLYSTTDCALNPVPLTVRLKVWLPAATWAGARLVTLGGLEVRAFFVDVVVPPPPPQPFRNGNSNDTTTRMWSLRIPCLL